ncbi:MAG: FAD-dependent oxidoreductase [Cyclobacteriaceae bacterium]
MLSFWEKKEYTHYDYAVIGAGITGLSTAISLKEMRPTASVVVLERGFMPTGASTKNAGFACFGSLTELMTDIDAMGEEAMLQLVMDRWQGLQLLRSRLGDATIDLQLKGGYELISNDRKDCLDHLGRMNELLKGHFEQDVFQLRDDLLPQFGFNRDQIHHLILNPLEGQIDTGKMMKALQAKAANLGVELILNAPVESTEKGRVVTQLAGGAVHTLSADQIAVCTNAFTKKLLPELPLTPGRGIVLVTKPLDHLPFEGTFHMNEGYDYFRDFYGRIIYGGSRDVDFANESTTEFGINETILEELKRRLTTTILGHDKYEIDHVWSGIMAFGEDKRPVVKRIDEYTVAGVRLGGMGVALGSLVGQKLAELLTADA